MRVRGSGSRQEFAKIHEAVMATSPDFYNLSRPVALKPIPRCRMIGWSACIADDWRIISGASDANNYESMIAFVFATSWSVDTCLTMFPSR